jgi:hypothetical protein
VGYGGLPRSSTWRPPDHDDAAVRSTGRRVGKMIGRNGEDYRFAERRWSGILGRGSVDDPSQAGATPWTLTASMP